ncbi:MAG: outer membrane beta-barrel protein [Bacteroidia bacterium]|nr:outer membrane beta-barrel protein [Bacteroidia bacterium]
MKKIVLNVLVLSAVCLLGTTPAFSQSGRFSIGLEGAFPTGDFGDAAGTGFGASVRYEHPVSDNIALTGTVGYITFGSKTESVPGFEYKFTWSMIPVQVGAKYYFSEMMNGFYGAVELGIHASSAKSTVTIMGTEVSNTASSSDFSYAPEIGYHLANIDIGARYQMISTTGSTSSYFGIRAAYVFGGK